MSRGRPGGRLARVLAAGLLLALPLLASCRPAPEPEPGAGPRGKSATATAAGGEAVATGNEDAELERVVAVQEQRGEVDGRWRGYRTHAHDADLSAVQREQVERLEAIGYATGSSPPPERSGVTVHDRDRAHAGLQLLTSGHAQVAQLMDMDGRVLHEWSADFWSIWPDYPTSRSQPDTQYWRRVHLFDNGDLLAIYEGLGIVKLDEDSRVLWAVPNRAHHDLQVLPDGTIAVLTREAHVLPRIHPERPVLEDFVTLLEPDGTERSRLSLLECFENSERHRRVLAGLGDKEDLDLLHTNALRVLDGSAAGVRPVLAAGRYLICSYKLDRLAVIDPDAREVVWTLRRDWHRPHDPQLLPGGHLLIFDNRGRPGRSRVLEFDLRAPQDPVWHYEGTAERPFYSHTCGNAQRLPGGNTLIVESDNGRAFEVTPEGEIVWEFVNPHRAGEDGEFIASLMDLRRLPDDAPPAWLVGEGG